MSVRRSPARLPRAAARVRPIASPWGDAGTERVVGGGTTTPADGDAQLVHEHHTAWQHREMTTPGEFNRQLAAAARDMANEDSTQATLQRAVALATELIDGCDLAGVSVVHTDHINTPAATDETFRVVDEAQFQMRQGPCLDALKDHETVSSNDLATDERWPEWGPRMVDEAGVKSCLCFQLFTDGDSLGALNLYSRDTHGFTSADLDNGLALAAQVAIALAAAQNEDHLITGLVNRTVIGQAQGILMERYDLSSDAAFHVLVRFSTSLNAKLHEVARRIVTTGHLPDSEL
jgi:transcriptional regulator with GAF, ATPase, and Fis domain